MALTLRRRILSMTIIYSLMLIGIVFILTWRAYSTQREIERIVKLQSDAVDALDRFKIFHAGLQSSLERAATPDMFVAAIEQYPRQVGQYRAALTLVPALPPELLSGSSELDGLMAVAASRWPEWTEAERRRGLDELRQEIAEIVRLSDDSIAAAKREIDRRLESLVRSGRDTMWTALGAAYIIAIMGFAIVHNAIKGVVRPLEALVRAAEDLAKEDYGSRAPVRGDREITELAKSFNRMAETIQAAVEARELQARTDDLTSLPNFRAFTELIAREMERAERYGHRFGLLIFDIDHFKKYNDSYGHLAGNEALQLVSATIRQTLRTVDTAARYGGEEFAAILPEIDEDALHKAAERARRAVQNLPPIGDRRRITVSIGGAIFPQDGRAAEALFHAADQRLYEAKEKGRNMVITPDPAQRHSGGAPSPRFQ